MKKEKNRIFKEYKDVEGFQGVSVTDDNLIVYWETKEDIQVIDSEFEIMHEVIGKITPQ
ncbi:MAG: hypothetical protein SLAVMIC_00841 [uncultured marine phage]|uniref:Uncharacterized protein n=1 Tax=uncultured marine phage TaxID=707152 RepID=A0A8D9CCT3_9VIRU|nr:MAG: hypothetical protein SLAVMIC_00841 [uncultured marine phage]